jgi:hypothetical protein
MARRSRNSAGGNASSYWELHTSISLTDAQCSPEQWLTKAGFLKNRNEAAGGLSEEA